MFNIYAVHMYNWIHDYMERIALKNNITVNFTSNINESDFIYSAIWYKEKFKNISNNKNRYINVFPNHELITNKEYLTRAIYDLYGSKQNVIPKTLIFNGDYNLIKLLDNKKVYIIKPPNEFFGRDIEILYKQDIVNYIKKSKYKVLIIQEYLADPLLIKHLSEKFLVKFDIRVNILLTENKKSYIIEPFSVRSSDVEYDLSNFSHITHITNLYGREKSKNSLREFDTIPSLQPYKDKIIKFCKKYIKKLLELVYIKPNNTGKYFQIFGLDLMITNNGDIKLIEINTNPGLVPDSYYDYMCYHIFIKPHGEKYAKDILKTFIKI